MIRFCDQQSLFDSRLDEETRLRRRLQEMMQTAANTMATVTHDLQLGGSTASDAI